MIYSISLCLISNAQLVIEILCAYQSDIVVCTYSNTIACQLLIISTLCIYCILYNFFLSEDSSFLDISEQFDKGTSEVSVLEEQDEDETTKEAKPVEEALSKEHTLRLKLLSALSEHLPQVEEVGGTRVIPYMQVSIYMLVAILVYSSYILLQYSIASYTRAILLVQ